MVRVKRSPPFSILLSQYNRSFLGFQLLLMSGNFGCPSGGGEWIPAMTGPMHPPCRRKKLRPLRPRLTARTAPSSVPSSSPHRNRFAYVAAGHQFSSRRKRSNALRGDERRGTRKGRLRFLRMSSARGVALARALVVVEWTSSSFRCRSSGGRGGALRGSCGLPVRDAAVPLRGWRCLYRIHFPEKAGPSREDVLVNCY